VKDLSGRVAVVTGAASGIGRAMAEKFLDKGARVVLADVENDALQRTVGELNDAGGAAAGMRVDVRDAAQVEDLATFAHESFGAVHILCNNAGVDTGGPFAEISDAAWRWVMDVNFFGVVNGCRAFLPLLREQDEAHIVNTASLAAVNSGMRTMAPYIASKFAVLGSPSNSPQPIRVSVSPFCCPAGSRPR